jgi:hypothetical protein
VWGGTSPVPAAFELDAPGRRVWQVPVGGVAEPKPKFADKPARIEGDRECGTQTRAIV